MMKSSGWSNAGGRAEAPTSRSAVVKALLDSRWDRLRTPGGLSLVIVFALVVTLVGPVVVWFVDDGRGILPLVLVGSIFASWFLLRRAVRFVPDSSDAGLDERLISIRDRVYLSAYRVLAAVMGTIFVVLLIWSIASIRSGIPSLSLTLTWPQFNAALWFVMALLLLLPSLSLAISIVRRKVQL